MQRRDFGPLLAALLLATASQVDAKVPAQESAQLAQSLTPVGAEKAASADGRIPAWTGGVSAVDFRSLFSNFKQGDFDPELFASDWPLFKITRDNYRGDHSRSLDGERHHSRLFCVYVEKTFYG